MNLAGVTFMDSTGLHALLRARTALAASVAGWSSPSRVGRRTRLFQLAGLLDTFELAGEPS